MQAEGLYQAAWGSGKWEIWKEVEQAPSGAPGDLHGGGPEERASLGDGESPAGRKSMVSLKPRETVSGGKGGGRCDSLLLQQGTGREWRSWIWQ